MKTTSAVGGLRFAKAASSLRTSGSQRSGDLGRDLESSSPHVVASCGSAVRVTVSAWRTLRRVGVCVGMGFWWVSGKFGRGGSAGMGSLLVRC